MKPQACLPSTRAGYERVAIALGSNLGKRRALLDDAVRQLREVRGLSVLAVSRWIETAAVGGPLDQPPYLNGALLADCRLGARELLSAMQAIESAAGRDRRVEAHHGPRTLDLDLLVFGELRSGDAFLELPHPRLLERRFVLEPLAEIAPALALPGADATVIEALRRLDRQAAI